MPEHRIAQTFGLVLWRGGLLLAGGYASYWTVRKVLAFFDIPGELVLGAGLLVTGCGFVFVSILLEQIGGRRTEHANVEASFDERF